VTTSLDEFARNLKEQPPALALVSLDALMDHGGVRPHRFSGIGHRMIGYYSHVQSDNATKAVESGFEMVLTRGAFSTRLLDILGAVGR